jgi:cyanate lyase
MPRFYFDVREGLAFTKDTKGIVYKDVAQAEREACITAAEIGRDALPKGNVRDVIVEVSNQHRQRIITVRLRMDVDRVTPEPSAPAA